METEGSDAPCVAVARTTTAGSWIKKDCPKAPVGALTLVRLAKLMSASLGAAASTVGATVKTTNIIALGLIGFTLVSGCGGNGNTAVTTIPTAHLSVTLPSATAVVGAPFTFTVTALDATNVVVPTYVGIVQIATSDNSAILPPTSTLAQGKGTFTAIFRTTGNQTITATDTVGNATSGTSAAISVNRAVVAVTITPATVTLPLGGTQAFSATVAGTGDQEVTWSLLEGVPGGSITAAGVYTAPRTKGSYHIVATSSADATKSATATVSVASTISITPVNVTIVPGGTQMFTATVTDTTNTAVTFRVLDGAAGGTINAAGGYTAPPTLGSYRVVATSVADNTQTAQAIVTVWPSGPATTLTGSMIRGRGRYTATLLTNGQVFVTGGDIDSSGYWDYGGIANAELYDPLTLSFAETGLVIYPRSSQTATLLPNGKVLLAGGFATGGSANNSAELYDPITGTFALASDMSAPRAGQTATLLPSGLVLITGGIGHTGGPASFSAEIYDPNTGVFKPTGETMWAPRYGHSATLLANGKVLIAGGLGRDYLDIYYPQAELYDPASDSFSPVAGDMRAARYNHTATPLSGGTKVLVTGGSGYPPGSLSISDYAASLTGAEIYDATTDSFTATGNLHLARSEHTATLLNSGLASEAVLVAGGTDVHGDGTGTMELFDPISGTFAPSGTMHTARSAHTATLLKDAHVLFAGGEQSGTTAELYP